MDARKLAHLMEGNPVTFVIRVFLGLHRGSLPSNWTGTARHSPRLGSPRGERMQRDMEQFMRTFGRPSESLARVWVKMKPPEIGPMFFVYVPIYRGSILGLPIF